MVQSPAEMQMHDDLAAMLAQRLTLEPAPAPPPVTQTPQITYSISQHYHHSAHAAKQQEQRPQAEQVQQSTEPSDADLLQSAHLLSANGVDAHILSRPLLHLFNTADDTLKAGLIGFWRLLPEQMRLPTGHPDSAEEMTRLFLSVREQQQRQQQQEQLQPQRSRSAPIPMQGGDGRWPNVTAEMVSSTESPDMTEPYMLSGYEQLARREYLASAAAAANREEQQTPRQVADPSYAYSSATDPVYRTTNDGGGGWADARQRQQQEAMEDQYGALMQMRGDDMEL